MPHPRVAKEVSIRGPKSIALLFFIACLSALCALWATAQENRLHKNYEEPQGVYRELAAPLHPRTAAKELSFQYFPPGNDAKDTAPSLRNVQILYLDTAKFMSNMAFMAQSLGVQCNYCHDLNDFSSDALPAKKRAREMIQMVQKLNKNQQQGGINCHTCHQGKTLARAAATRQPKEQKLEAGEPTTAESASPPGKAQQTLPELAGTPEQQQEADTSSRPPGSAEGWSDDSVQRAIGGKEVVDRLKDRLADRLLSQGADYTEQLGQKKFFGKYFQIDADLRLGKRGLYGDLDILIPLGGTENESAWFLQPGLVLWEDRHGIDREDFSLGLAHRFHPDESAVFGLGGFYDYNADYGHQRLGLSADYQSGAGYLSLNLYKRLSGWKRGRSEDVFEYEESALDGAEFYFDYALTEPLRVQGRASIWKSRLGNRPENTRTGHEIGLAHTLWPGVELTANYSRYDGELYDDRWSLGLHLRLPVREQQSPAKFRPDLFRPIERQKRIFTEERVITLPVLPPLPGPGTSQTVFLDVAFPLVIPALPEQPTADVSVTPDHSGTESVEYSTAGSNGPFDETITLIFTPNNWDQPQTVWVRILPRPARASSPIDFAVGATKPGTLQNAGGGVLRQVEASSLTITWAYRSEDPRYDGLSSSLTLEVRAPDRSTLGFSQASYDVNEADGSVTVEITLSAAAVADVNVTLFTADGTAIAPDDYTAVSTQTLTIRAGDTRTELTIAVADDALVEGDEQFTIMLSTGSPPAVVSLGSITIATLTIADDDTAPDTINLSLGPTSVTEEGGTQTVTVTATVQGVSRFATPQTVSVTVAATSAETTDFAAVTPFDVTIAAGAASGEATFDLSPVNDVLAEGNETLTVSGASGTLAVSPATLTITDDDTAPDTIVLSLNPASVAEEDGAQTVTVTAAVQGTSRFITDQTVNVTVAADSAESPADFAAVTPFDITIAAGAASGEATFDLSPVNDVLAEGNETLTVSGTSGTLTVNPATLTITDDDTAPDTIVLSLSPDSVTEEGGPQTVTVTAAVQGTSRFITDQTVNVTVAADSAESPADFAEVAGFEITIAAGAASGEETFDLSPVNDVLAEGNETLTVSGTSGTLTVNPATLTITDDDTAPDTIVLSLNPASVTEEGGPQTVTVTAAVQGTSRFITDQTVNVTVAADSAESPADFAAVTPFDVTIAAGAASGEETFDLSPVNDVLAEGNETLTVSGTSGTLTVNPATLTITDDDTAPDTISLSLSPDSVTEEGGTQTVTVTAAVQGTSRFITDQTVSVTVAADSAETTDFAAVTPFDITITAGAASGETTFELSPVNDVLAEGNETLTVSGASGTLAVSPATLTITDDDTAPDTIVLSLNPASVTEEGGAQTVTVTAAVQGTSRFITDQTVNVTVAADSAESPADFAEVAGFEITIAAGAASGEETFDLSPVNDVLAEGNETLTVSGTSGTLTVNPATLTITDDDTAPDTIVLSLNPASVTEEGGAQTVTVTAAVQGTSRFITDQTVNVTVAADSAESPADFAEVAGFEITIAAGAASGEETFDLSPVNDVLAEGNETLTVSGTSGTLTVNPATLTITDDDTAPDTIVLSLNPASVAEEDGAQTVTVTAAVQGTSRFITDQTVNVTVAADSAESPADFAEVAGFEITIAAGATSGETTFELSPVNDVLAEGNETLTVSGASGTLTVNPATLTITDDDTAPDTIVLSLNPASVTEEGGAQTVTVTAAVQGTSRFITAQTVSVTVAADSAESPADFAEVAGFEITITAGAASGEETFELSPVNDVLAEGNETLTVSGASGTLTVNPATLTITDDDTAPNTIVLSLNPASVAEEDGAQTVTVTAAVQGTSRFITDQTVNVTVAAASAESPADFAEVAGFEITIAAGAASGEATFELSPVNDVLAEGNETLTVSGASGTLTVNPATLTITDDDTAPDTIVLSLNPASVAEEGGPQTVTVTAAVQGTSRFITDQTVNVTVAAASAESPADFAEVAGFEITIAAGAASGEETFDLSPVNDVLAEGNETLTVSGTSGTLTVNPATLTITDDDTAPDTIVLSLNPASVTEEGGPQTVTVTAAVQGTSRFITDQTVNVTVAAASAESPADFAEVAGFEITIAAGAASGEETFDLSPVNDVLAEGNETLTVSGASGTLTVNPATLTITDDDTAPDTIVLSLNPASVAEEGGTQTVTVTAAVQGTSRFITDQTVNVTVAAASAESPADFAEVAGFEITIAAGAASGEETFDLSPVNDVLAEGNETLTVSGASGTLTVNPATLTITDDDTAPDTIVLSLNPVSVTEEGGAQTVTVTAAVQGTSRFITAQTVSVTVAAASAESPADFAEVAGFEITIAAGAASGEATFELSPVNDMLGEGSETLTVSGVSGTLTVNPATLTITDDDTAPDTIVLSLNPASVTEEGGPQTVTVTAAVQGTSRFITDQTVNVTVAAASAESPADFAEVAGFEITIAAGAASGEETFDLSPVNDVLAEGNETLTVSGASGTLTVNPATLTITDDDTAPDTISLSLSPDSVTEEGGAQTVTVTAAVQGTSRFITAQTVSVTVAADSAETTDFAAVAPFDITITAGAASGEETFDLSPVSDVLAEGNETLTVSGASGTLTVNPATLTITDDDTAPDTIVLSLNPVSVTEEGGAQTVTVTATVQGVSRFATPQTVSVTVTADSAETTDFAEVAGFEITITAGAASGEETFDLSPVSDVLAEGNETLTVSGASGTLAISPATLTITDDDTAPDTIVLSLNPASVTEEGGAQTVTVTAAVQGTSRFITDQTVNVTVAADSAESPADFAAVAGFEITIAAGAASGEETFDLSPVNDVLAEGNETLTVSGASGTLTVNPATLTITDDDTAPDTIVLSLNPASVTEEDGAQTVTVTAAVQGTSRFITDQTVNVTVAAASAESPADFAEVAGFEITIAAGAASGEETFDLSPVNDVLAEGNETLTVSGASGTLTVNPATLTITDDDTAPDTIVLSLNPVSVTEEGGAQTVTVTATVQGVSRFATPQTVSVTVTADSAETTDFAAVTPFDITITAGAASGEETFDLSPVSDVLAEGNETLTVSGAIGTLTVNPATLTITDDDTAPDTIVLSLNPDSVTEEGGAQTVTVTATVQGVSRFATPQTVSVTVTADSAETTDFAAVTPFDITITAGAASGEETFDLSPVSDVLAEGNETLTVSGAIGTLTVNPATLTITDDDTAPDTIVLSLNPDSVAEEDGAQTVTVTAAVQGTSRFITAQTVSVTVAADSAETTDFAAVAPFDITITAGAASGEETFDLSPVNDVLAEGNETLTVSGASGTLTVNTATLTITDDDTAPDTISLSLNPDSVTEEGGAQTVTVTATVQGASRFATPQTVSVTVTADSAETTDFAEVAGFEITITAGAASGEETFDLSPVSDVLAEGNETLTVSGTSGTLTVNPATLTITDDDTAPDTIVLSLNPASVTEEGGAQTVTVTAAVQGTSRFITDQTVNVTVAADSAESPADFAAVAPFDITITAGAASGEETFDLSPVSDVLAEGNETLTVSGASGTLAVNPATLTITDDDSAPDTISLSLSPDSVTEEGGAQTVTVTAAVQGTSRFITDQTVSVTVTADSAETTDFAAVAPFDITITAGAASGEETFDLSPVSDVLAEGNETLTVSGASGTLAVSPATLTITDDDTAPDTIVLSLNPASVTEEGGAQTVTVTAAVQGTSRFITDQTVNVTVAADSAESPADFAEVAPFDITITAGAASGEETFDLSPVSDVLAEGNETLTVSGVSGTLAVSPATLTITDDDTAPDTIVLSLSPDSVTEEGGAQTVTVTATVQGVSRFATPQTVSVTVTADSAETTDFAAVAGFEITITAGAASGEETFDLSPVSDVLAEGNETLTVSGTSGTLTVNPATLTITDDDTAPDTISLSLSPDSVAEEGGAQTVTVTAAVQGTSRFITAQTVSVTVAADSAETTDFAAVTPFDVTIAAGAASGEATFDLSPVSDVLAEGNETLTVSGVSGTLTVNTATLTITDDDTAPDTIVLSLNPDSVAEEGGAQTVTVTATVQGVSRFATPQTVSVTVAADSAESPADFAAVAPFDITIAAGADSGEGTFSLSPVDDALVEGDEMLTVSGASALLTVTPAMLTIGDDDMVGIGETTYESECANCHASPNAFGAPALGSASDWRPRINRGIITLYSSALDGVPGTAMPAFRDRLTAEFTADVIEATVDYIVEQSGVTPAPSTADGLAVYQTNCSICHTPPGLPGIPAPQLGTADWTPRINRGIITLYDSALDGVPPFMPAFRSSLSADEIEAVVDYIVDQAP